MKLSGISISVSDLDKSVKYYCDVFGAHYFDTFMIGIGKQAILTTDNKMRITLIQSDKMPAGKIIDMSYLSMDIEKDMEELQSKGAIIKQMPMQVSMAKLARLEDPDGVNIMVVQWNEAFDEKEIPEESFKATNRWVEEKLQ